MSINIKSETRGVKDIIATHRKEAARGFFVDSPLPGKDARYLDPFLMLDHFGPVQMQEGEDSTVSDHPHRGFEAVTFLFEGYAEHSDSAGHRAVIESGGVQWITAAGGIIHREVMRPSPGGKVHGIQLWVNLPKKHKMDKPKYQNIHASSIPVVSKDNDKVSIRVIAGEILGTKGPAQTYTPILALHIIVQPGGQVEIPIPDDYNAGIYITEGAGEISGKEISAKNLAILDTEGKSVSIANPPDNKEAFNMLLIAGKPIGEPIMSYGPFVMNTGEEIRQAIYDYENGKMGKIE